MEMAQSSLKSSDNSRDLEHVDALSSEREKGTFSFKLGFHATQAGLVLAL